VRAIAPMLARLVGEQVTIDTVLEDDGQRTRVDPSQLEQVLVNLAANARDVMPAGGRLLLATRAVTVHERDSRHTDIAPGHYVVLEARDTGPGVPRELRSRVFDPFFTTKARGSGTGLGLSVVYGVVRQAGGAVRVDDAPGGGARFELFFPVVAEGVSDGEPRVTPRDDAVQGGSEHVLLVEDEPSVRAVAARILTAAGYRVTAAANGAEALRLFGQAEQPIDLLLTDLVMPGIGGRELADRLMANHPELRVLYTSGYTDDEVMLRGIAEEGLHFLPKPASRAELLRKVREALRAGATAPRP
jgi:two-component system, cell cycle sensor histidine kinase and response regulator CckA